MTDEHLVALTQRGNAKAFNVLTLRFEAGLFRYVVRLLGDSDDARDVCQDALLKAYTNIRRLRDPKKFKSWLHQIALNLCRDRFRSARPMAGAKSYDDEGSDESRVAIEGARRRSPEDRASQGLLIDSLKEILLQIPMEQRSALLLREYHGFTSEEIGEITGVPAATVRTRIFYGLRAIRRQMAIRGLDGSSPQALQGDR